MIGQSVGHRSFDSLSALLRQALDDDPLSAHWFVFHNRTGDRLKILAWEEDGWCLWYKTLETISRYPDSANTRARDTPRRLRSGPPFHPPHCPLGAHHPSRRRPLSPPGCPAANTGQCAPRLLLRRRRPIAIHCALRAGGRCRFVPPPPLRPRL